MDLNDDTRRKTTMSESLASVSSAESGNELPLCASCLDSTQPGCGFSMFNGSKEVFGICGIGELDAKAQMGVYETWSLVYPNMSTSDMCTFARGSNPWISTETLLRQMKHRGVPSAQGLNERNSSKTKEREYARNKDTLFRRLQKLELHGQKATVAERENPQDVKADLEYERSGRYAANFTAMFRNQEKHN